MHRVKLLILLSTYFMYTLLYNATPVYSQQSSYVRYTTFDGLPSQVTYCVMQDSKGFIWFGTQNGLCRFDGANFKTYTTDDGLPDNEVLDIIEDKSGRLWLSLFNGGACYFKDGQFHSAINDSLLAKVSGIGSFVNYYIHHNKKGIYMHGGETVSYISEDLKIIKRHEGIYSGKATRFIESTEPSLLTNKKIYVFNDGDIINTIDMKQLFSYPIPSSSFFFRNTFYTTDYAGKMTIYILQNDYRLKHIVARDFGYTIENIYTAGENMYITTADKVLLRYSKNDTLLENPSLFLTGSMFNKIIEDNEMGLWITSLDGGVYYIPNENAKTFSTQTGLLDNSIYSIYENENKIYFGDSKGNIYTAANGLKIAALGNNAYICRLIKAFIVNGDHYLGTDRGLFVLDKTGTPHIVVSSSIKDLYYYNETIYIASNAGLLKKKIDEPNIDTLLPGRKTAVATDASGKVWFGDLNGLYTYQQQKSVAAFGNKYPLLKTRITGLALGHDGVFWVATQANGLLGLKNDSIFYVINKKNGLATNNIKSIYVNHSTISVATDKGVDIINYPLKTGAYSIKHIDKMNGLADNDVNRVYLKADTLYAGTAQGFSIVPLTAHLNKPPPAVYITGFAVNNRDTSITGKLEIPYFNNSVVVNYIALSYSSAGKLKYRYRLSKSERWHYTTSTQVSLVELQPGNYRFEVQVQNVSGSWGPGNAIREFEITPPVWKTKWFLMLATLFLIAVITTIYFNRIRRFKRSIIIENKMLQSEIKALRAQMNPHFIFNSLNSIQSFIFNNKKEEANEYLSEFSRLMRMILDHSQSNFISVAEEMEFLNIYLKLEQLRLGNKFTYSINHDPHSHIPEMLIPSMLIQPFVENAVLHGIAPKNEPASLRIKFLVKGQQLLCSIDDDGVGLPEITNANSRYHRPFGIKSLRDRIHTINLAHHVKIDFKVEDKKIIGSGNGTLVTIFLGKTNAKVHNML